MDLDSAQKNPTSSVKRRRTTQVINITMTKVDETLLKLFFYKKNKNSLGFIVFLTPMCLAVSFTARSTLHQHSNIASNTNEKINA